MALHLHPMLSLAASRISIAGIPSAHDHRQQKMDPPPPVRDLGPRAMQRLMNLRREELEQELEDLESLRLTEEQRISLERSFSSVKFEVADLDGLSWASPDGQHMLARWYTLQVAAIHEEFGLSGDEGVCATSDSHEFEYEEYVDCEPPPSSASDCTIVPDRDDIPCVDVEPPSPPPTARPTHIPPPLVWPTDHYDALSPRSADFYTPRSPRSPSSPVSPGTLRRHRGRAYPMRRTPTHRVFSVPACASPHRELLDRRDVVRNDQANPALPPKRAGAMPKPMTRQLPDDPHPPPYVSLPAPDSPTLGSTPQEKRHTANGRRVMSVPAGLGAFPVPPMMQRTFSECPEGPLSPDSSLSDSVLGLSGREQPFSMAEQEPKHSTNVSSPTGSGSLATKLAGLRIALPDLSSFSGRALGLWGTSEPTSHSQADELMPPLRRMGPAMGLRRDEIEGAAGGAMTGSLWA